MRKDQLEAGFTNFDRLMESRKSAKFSAIELDASRDKRLLVDAHRMVCEYRSQAAELIEALWRIHAIPNRQAGGDWDEIEEARLIARDAIYAATGEEQKL